MLLINISPYGIYYCYYYIYKIDYYRNRIIDNFMEVSETILRSNDKQIKDLTLILLSILIRNDCIL